MDLLQRGSNIFQMGGSNFFQGGGGGPNANFYRNPYKFSGGSIPPLEITKLAQISKLHGLDLLPFLMLHCLDSMTALLLC